MNLSQAIIQMSASEVNVLPYVDGLPNCVSNMAMLGSGEMRGRAQKACSNFLGGRGDQRQAPLGMLRDVCVRLLDEADLSTADREDVRAAANWLDAVSGLVEAMRAMRTAAQTIKEISDQTQVVGEYDLARIVRHATLEIGGA